MIINKFGYTLDTDTYWMKQWHKIAYYVSRIHKYEILKMDCNFMKDDDGKIWLFYASNILVRKIYAEPGETRMQELDFMTKNSRK